jgi:hypothetical protein
MVNKKKSVPYQDSRQRQRQHRFKCEDFAEFRIEFDLHYV